MHRVFALAWVFAAGCAAAVEAPAAPEAVVALADAYEEPSATLTEATARSIVDRTEPLREVLQAVRGLAFIRDVVENATSIRDVDLESLGVRGELEARSACPGWDPAEAPDSAVDGSIEVTIGVEASRVQRAFAGRATNCRFVTTIAGRVSQGVASMDLEVDLGDSFGFGEPAPEILVRATNLSGSVGDVALNLGSQVLSFRLLEGDAIDTLVDTSTLGVALRGSVLLAVQRDGAVTVESREGTWRCSEGESACTRVTAAS